MNHDHKEPKRAVIYARVASRRLNDQHAIERQLDNGQRTAVWLGAVVDAVVLDVGVSGLRSDRPGLAAIFTHLERSRADYVICEEVTRLTRDYRAWPTILERISETGAVLVCGGHQMPPTFYSEERAEGAFA